MSFVHSSLEECTKSELDLFSIPPTHVAQVKRALGRPPPCFQRSRWWIYYVPVPGHQGLCGFSKNHIGGKSKSNQGKW